MDTDALIEALARDARPVHRHAAERRLARGIAAGSVLAVLLLIGGIGIRPDLAAAAAGTVFWAKAAYTLALGLAGVALAAELARPESRRPRRLFLVAVPIGIASLLATAELARAAPDAAVRLLVEPSWICLPLILALAAPIFAGLAWAFQRLAPTRLPLAGAAAGLAAGGFAATLYGLYCEQVSPTYVLTRYTLAIALAAAAGALLGRRLLRW